MEVTVYFICCLFMGDIDASILIEVKLERFQLHDELVRDIYNAD